MADLWEWEESRARGFASRRAWKQAISAKEYDELREVKNQFYYGADRRDYGLVLAALGIMRAAGARLTGFDWTSLLPNKPPVRHQTPQEMLEQLEAISKQNGKVNRHAESHAGP